MKNILIIKCGETYPEIKLKHDDFEEWIIKQSNLPKKVFKIYNITEEEQPRHPSEYIAAIITGSHSNVNQRLPWIRHLKNWIISARYSNTPVLGICFGHQIIAEALGGKAIMNPNGPSIGAKLIKLTDQGIKDPLFINVGTTFESYKLNSFYVSKLPLGAKLLAQNEALEIEAFKLEKIYGIQFHPDFNSEIMQMYSNIIKHRNNDKIRVTLKNQFKNQSIISNFIDGLLRF